MLLEIDRFCGNIFSPKYENNATESKLPNWIRLSVNIFSNTLYCIFQYLQSVAAMFYSGYFCFGDRGGIFCIWVNFDHWVLISTNCFAIQHNYEGKIL